LPLRCLRQNFLIVSVETALACQPLPLTGSSRVILCISNHVTGTKSFVARLIWIRESSLAWETLSRCSAGSCLLGESGMFKGKKLCLEMCVSKKMKKRHGSQLVDQVGSLVKGRFSNEQMVLTCAYLLVSVFQRSGACTFETLNCSG